MLYRSGFGVGRGVRGIRGWLLGFAVGRGELGRGEGMGVGVPDGRLVGFGEDTAGISVDKTTGATGVSVDETTGLALLPVTGAPAGSESIDPPPPLLPPANKDLCPASFEKKLARGEAEAEFPLRTTNPSSRDVSSVFMDKNCGRDEQKSNTQ